jgi:hypothetical protein
MVCLPIICQIHQRKYRQIKKITDGMTCSFYVGDMLYSLRKYWHNKADNFFFGMLFFPSKVIDKIVTDRLTDRPQIIEESFCDESFLPVSLAGKFILTDCKYKY